MQLDDFTINCILLFYQKKIDSTTLWASKCSKNISDPLDSTLCPFFLFFPHFDVIHDLHVLLYRLTATWNLLF